MLVSMVEFHLLQITEISDRKCETYQNIIEEKS